MAVSVREETPAAVVLDLNALDWLSLATVLPGIPLDARVTSTAFRETISVRVE
jgi:hypothetical protein